jgi:co-chaperonin GroES (HSP10)
MNLTLIGPRVAIRPEKLPETSSDGTLHVVYHRRDSAVMGEVVALGDGPITAKGVQLDHYVKVGDRVMFSPDCGEELIFEKDVLVIMAEDEILAIVEQPNARTK